MSDIREQVDLIREVFAYADRFRGQTFVFKIDDQVLGHPDAPQHARDLALLHKSGIRIVLVPGAQERIDEVLHRFGVETQHVDGVRISPPESMDLIKMAAFDAAHRTMTALSGHGITAVIGNWVRARTRGVIQGCDFGRTGTVDRIRVDAVLRSLDQGHVPIFPCVGHNEAGDPFNLSSDELAITLARALGAKKIFFLTHHDGITSPPWEIPEGVEILDDGRVFRMTPSCAQEFISINPNLPQRRILKGAAEACRNNVDRAHILDGKVGGVLLKEVFSNLGMGTMVYSDAYERLRPMVSSDIPGVLEIMRPLVSEKVLVPRTAEDLERDKNDFWVYAMDGVVHGCAALHPQEDDSAEIAGVAVDPQYAQLGIGAKLLERLFQKARDEGHRKLFLLTTRTADWFLARGFSEGSVADLPASRLARYNASRNSRVLIKNL
ncbi:MAG: amino-acid N-acetyltransferase [Spirochaetales bacterium]|nr:amino-acid N-acetyltransferase [Spirochaetales bacterium]